MYKSWRTLSRWRLGAVQCPHASRATAGHATNRRTRPPPRRERPCVARVGAPVRSPAASQVSRRLPALLSGRREPGPTHAGSPGTGPVRCRGGARRAERERGRQADGGASRPDQGDGLAEAARALVQSLDEFDEPGAQSVLDRLFAQYTVETVLRDVVMPYLHELGERWTQGKMSVAGEHLASNLLRGRLASFARGWGRGVVPRAILACAPGEQHDLALVAFGIVLHRNGWRVEYLGADTPIEDVASTAADMCADIAVLVAATPQRFDGLTAGLSRLARIVRLLSLAPGPPKVWRMPWEPGCSPQIRSPKPNRCRRPPETLRLGRQALRLRRRRYRPRDRSVPISSDTDGLIGTDPAAHRTARKIGLTRSRSSAF